MPDFDEVFLKVPAAGSNFPDWPLEAGTSLSKAHCRGPGGRHLQQPVGEAERVKLVKLVKLVGL
jgi:hypothetical protein